MFGRKRKMHKKVKKQEKKPKKVTHEGVTYHRDTRGDYRNDDGDILPAIILLGILSDSGNVNAHDTTPDFTPGGGEFGGGGASESFNSSPDSDSSSSSDNSSSSDSSGGDSGGGGGGE